MLTIFGGSNSLNEKFGQWGISGHLGQKVNTISPVLAKITPDFDNITPLFDLISLFVVFL